MTNLPTVSILFMTKEVPGREGIALRVIESVKKNLQYDGQLHWVVADGNSGDAYLKEIIDAIGNPAVVSVPGQAGVVWNAGLNMIYANCPIYFRLEDDFELTAPLDITPYVGTLDNEDVGMVRLGLMPDGSALRSHGYEGEIYLEFLKSTQYCYSGHPGLVHKRFHEAYGLFDEHLDPGMIEVALDDVVRTNQGPRIWWPLLLARYGTYGPWSHIGEVQSY
jgi:hypothetical protein